MMGIGNLVGEAVKLFGRLVPDREAQGERNSSTNTEVIKAFGGTSYAGPNRTWFDSFVDGLNRLMRPVVVFSVFYIFSMPFWPGESGVVKFSAAMTAYRLVPQTFWEILFLVLGSLFVVRELYHHRAFKALKPEKVAEVLDSIRKIRALEKQENPPGNSEGFKIETTEHFEDESKPLSNDAILKWNRKNNPNFKQK